jgi:thiol-disulfide isomerase/thioredoxin
MNILLVATLWLSFAPIRDAGNLPPILADVESHLPAGHTYDDPDRITTVHECTHGINSELRQKYGQPCFYMLDDGVARLTEPKTTLSAVARNVPQSLRGEVYNLYLVNAQRDWNEQPSYVFDEWSAYTNGSRARNELGIKDRQETVRYMMEFCIYATCVARCDNGNDPNLKEFLKYQIERCVAIYDKSGVVCPILDKFANSPDAADLRSFAVDYYGADWCAKVFGDRTVAPMAPNAPGAAPAPPRHHQVSVTAYTAKWCAPCRKNHPVLIDLRAAGIQVNEIDVDENPGLAKRDHIESVPTYIINQSGIITRTSDPQKLRDLLKPITR